MGSIRKSKNGKGYEASISVNGKRKSKSFLTKAQAKIWISDSESECRKQASGTIVRKKFADIIKRYIKEVSPTKKGEVKEVVRLTSLLNDPLARLYADDIKQSDISDFRDSRLKDVLASTVNRDLNLISAIFTKCRDDWGYVRKNPVTKVQRPINPPHRDRLITDDEIEMLRVVFGYNGEIIERKQLVFIYFKLAIETAMRAGELLSVNKKTFHDKFVTLPKTKNGSKRDVPLSLEARKLFEKVLSSDLRLTSSNLDALFRKYRNKTDIIDLHFHDTRHTAITKLSKKIDVLDLARMVGHKDLKNLLIYYNEKPENIADKLD